MSAWKTLLFLESYKANDIRSNISKLRLEISNVAGQIKRIDELIFDYHEINSCKKGQRLDSYKVYQVFNLISHLESGRNQLYCTKETLSSQLIQGEELLALAEREKLKYQKLQKKADTLMKMQSLSKDQMEMDDIALHRFKKVT